MRAAHLLGRLGDLGLLAPLAAVATGLLLPLAAVGYVLAGALVTATPNGPGGLAAPLSPAGGAVDRPAGVRRLGSTIANRASEEDFR